MVHLNEVRTANIFYKSLNFKLQSIPNETYFITEFKQEYMLEKMNAGQYFLLCLLLVLIVSRTTIANECFAACDRMFDECHREGGGNICYAALLLCGAACSYY